MALALTISKTRYRYDSPILPVAIPTGITDVGRLFIYGKNAVNLYETVTNSAEYEYHPSNQSVTRQIQLRNVHRPSWTLGSHVSLVSSDPKKSTANDADGSYIGSLGANCSIEGKATAIDKKCGVSLQSGSVQYDESNASCEMALIFQADGLLAVYELGVRIEYTLTPYQVGDIGLIDKQGDIVRYFLVRNNVLRLIRTTRSKVSDSDVKGVLILYNIDAQLSEAYTLTDSLTKTLEVVAVLDKFQGWFNDYNILSTADSLLAQDNNPQFTYPNNKQTIRQLSADLNLVDKTERRLYVDFFNFHNTGQEFIFIDKAKKDGNNKFEWFWARFTSGFGDKSRRGGCLFAESAVITETFRLDNIPLEIIDEDPPTMPELTAGVDSWTWTESVDDISDSADITYIIEIDTV